MEQELENIDKALADHEGPAGGGKVFERHLKRRVFAPSHGFAAAAPPELAPICRAELAAMGIESVETAAGAEFEGKLDRAYLCHLLLRTAGRMLLRLPSFRAGAVEELFSRAAQAPWELWLNPAIEVQVEAFVEESRIENEGSAAETLLSAIRRRWRESNVAPPPVREEETGGRPPMKQRVLARVVKNHCQISLDMTGPHLHQRGYRIHHAGAPLRETLASAILLKSGWSGESALVDGMGGAGTLAIEGAMIARRIPPGLNRGFLFQQWPSFRAKTWDFLRRSVRSEILPAAPAPIVSIDRDEDAVATARENAARAGVEQDIEWRRGDFFDFRPRERGLGPGLLVLNPPYGKRLEGGGRLLYARIGTHVRAHYRGWKVAVIAPSRALAAGLNLPAMRLWKIPHGGLKVTVVMGMV